MKVSDVMTRGAATVKPDATIFDAACAMVKHDVGSLPVCNEGLMLQGIITDRDIVTRCVALGHDPTATPVADCMTGGVSCVEAETDLKAAAQLMAKAKVRRLPVVENGKIIGVLALGDIAVESERSAASALGEISEPAQPTQFSH